MVDHRTRPSGQIIHAERFRNWLGFFGFCGKMQHANSDLHVLCLAQFHLGPSFQLCLATGFVGLAQDRDDRVVGVAVVHVVIGVTRQGSWEFSNDNPVDLVKDIFANLWGTERGMLKCRWASILIPWYDLTDKCWAFDSSTQKLSRSSASSSLHRQCMRIFSDNHHLHSPPLLGNYLSIYTCLNHFSVFIRHLNLDKAIQSKGISQQFSNYILGFSDPAARSLTLSTCTTYLPASISKATRS